MRKNILKIIFFDSAKSSRSNDVLQNVWWIKALLYNFSTRYGNLSGGSTKVHDTMSQKAQKSYENVQLNIQIVFNVIMSMVVAETLHHQGDSLSL